MNAGYGLALQVLPHHLSDALTDSLVSSPALLYIYFALAVILLSFDL